MSTGLGKLQAAFAAHRTPILAGGAAATAALGLYVHHKNAAAGTPTPTAAAAAPVAGGATVAGVADPGSVDTTGSDVYNALQPQMAQEQSLLAQLLAALQNGVPKPAPKPPAKSPVDGSPPKRPGPIKPKPPVRAHPPKGPTKRPTPRRTYTVVKGDNLTSIGHRFHTTWQKIYAANRSTIGRNPNLIRPGQHLVIP